MIGTVLFNIICSQLKYTLMGNIILIEFKVICIKRPRKKNRGKTNKKKNREIRTTEKKPRKNEQIYNNLLILMI